MRPAVVGLALVGGPLSWLAIAGLLWIGCQVLGLVLGDLQAAAILGGAR